MPSSKKNYIFSVGRRKRAIARVRIMRGKEEIIVNGQPASQYFPGILMQKILINPLKLADLAEKYTATVKVVGSGKLSQLQAVVHGLARSIAQLDANKHKPAMRSAGLLTRDPRKRQRRNIGTGGKARRQKQSPKR